MATAKPTKPPQTGQRQQALPVKPVQGPPAPPPPPPGAGPATSPAPGYVPPAPPGVNPYAANGQGLYVGRNGTLTSLPQPLVDALAPTYGGMPPSFGEWMGAGSPLGRPVKPSVPATGGAQQPTKPPQTGPGGPQPVVPPQTGGRKKKRAAAKANPFV